MSEMDQFFDEEIKAIAVEGRAIAYRAAEELQEDVIRQIRRNFNNPSVAFQRGVAVEHFEGGSYVRLSPILSAHAQNQTIEGSSNLWILLRDGARLGFKRIGTAGFNWDYLKRRYGNRLSFVPVADGYVVLYRTPSEGVKPIYKIQQSVTTKQRIEFYKRAEVIGEKLGHVI